MNTSHGHTHIGIVGGGIVGLATAWTIVRRHPGFRVTVLEKESEVARHQTSRNSGVVHTGIYYTPGSLKARLCTRGKAMLERFCAERGLPYEQCGKILIGFGPTEDERLHTILGRGIANGVPGLRLIRAAEIGEIEPCANGRVALHVPTAAITDFAQVARGLAREVLDAGGLIITGAEVTAIEERFSEVRVKTNQGGYSFDRVVTCAGLYSDRVAELSGDKADPRIVPFRGDYFRIRPERAHLVRGLIYPVPDPRFPFLGIHLTRTVEGEVLVGPNAILAFAREGYKLTTVNWDEFRMTLRWPGFRAMARRHWRTGVGELYRVLSRRAFMRQARRYVPELQPRDVIKGASGVRAQAVASTGELVDDFRMSRHGRVVNIRNAPSPAATSSLAIAEMIAAELTDEARSGAS